MKAKSAFILNEDSMTKIHHFLNTHTLLNAFISKKNDLHALFNRSLVIIPSY